MKSKKILFVGDIVLRSEPVFDSALTDLFNETDIKCCNFEAPIEKYGTPIHKAGPLVNQLENAPDLVLQKGFSVINLANNHIMDYNYEALEATLKAFKNEITIGAGTWQEAYQLKILNKEDTTFGFLSFGENCFGALADEFDKVGYAWINHPCVNDLIKQSKQKVDVLIVQCHAGVELIDVPLPEWRKRYRELVDCGADAVIAHHPHVPQGVEIYKNAPIYYSLGNFYFDYPNSDPRWNTGMIAQLEVQDKKIVSNKTYFIERKENTVSLLSAAISEQKQHHLNKLLEEPYYLDLVNSEVLRIWQNGFVQYYEKGVTGISKLSIISILKHVKRILKGAKTNYAFLWHNLHIESNRWLAERAINIKFKKRN